MEGYIDPIYRDAINAVPIHVKKEVSRSFAISNRIQELMDEKSLKQSDLAKLTGKKKPEVSKWLSGSQNFTLRTIALIEEALGADLIKVTSQNDALYTVVVIDRSSTVTPYNYLPAQVKRDTIRCDYAEL